MVLTHAEGLSHLERWFCQMLIIEEQDATVFKTVALEATEENVYEPLVSSRVTSRTQYLKPEYVVAQSI
jgi:hypothetical protein